MAEEQVLVEATFNPKVKTYWLLSGAIVFVISVVGIPLLPIWFLIGFVVTQKYLDKMHCRLCERSLQVGKGLLVRVEKTVPLEKITDVGLVQGPIMRAMDLHALSFETAGQSSQGALVRMTGIENAMKFREAVLARRDELAGATKTAETPVVAAQSDGATIAVLEEIRDTLKRIEGKIGE